MKIKRNWCLFVLVIQSPDIRLIPLGHVTYKKTKYNEFQRKRPACRLLTKAAAAGRPLLTKAAAASRPLLTKAAPAGRPI